MGVFKLFSSSSYNKQKMSKSIGGFSSSREEGDDAHIPEGNPDPYKYQIIKAETVGKFLIVWINYPNCSNYEGNKILVYENCQLEDLLKQKHIDPHFSENRQFYSPIARFEPTERGWDMSKSFCNFYHL